MEMKTWFYTEGPRIARILGLQKTALHEIRISGTVGGPRLNSQNDITFLLFQMFGPILFSAYIYDSFATADAPSLG